MRSMKSVVICLVVSTSPALAGEDGIDPRPTTDVTVASTRLRDPAEVSYPGLVVGPERQTAGALYLSGGADVMRIDLDAGTTSTIAVPGSSDTYMLARSDDHQRLFVSSPDDHLLSAIDLKARAVSDQVVISDPGYFTPAVLAVAPGGERVNLTDMLSDRLLTFAAGDLHAAPIAETVPGLEMPGWIGYRPGSLDLYVADFHAGPDQIAVRRPTVDWQSGDIVFDWSGLDLPASQTNDDGDTAAGMDFLDAQGLVFATNSRGDEVVVFDEPSGKALATSPVAAMPLQVTADPLSDAAMGRVFVTSIQGIALTVFDVKRDGGKVTLDVERRFDPCTNPSPTKVVFGADPATAYLLCTGEVVMLDSASLDVVGRIPVDAEYADDMVWAKQ
jgi:DNA-binding beta-propeller fold protein YncE